MYSLLTDYIQSVLSKYITLTLMLFVGVRVCCLWVVLWCVLFVRIYYDIATFSININELLSICKMNEYLNPYFVRI